MSGTSPFFTGKCIMTILLFYVGTPTAQINVNINSGDPVCPFPQFQPYITPTDTFYNLATYNGVGVPHAEMEKTIRDAYQIMMNRASKPGGGVGGVEYIRYKSTPQCSEGDGYGLLGAVAMADKKTFDGMWLYIHDFNMNNVVRYSDCKDATPGYAYSRLPGWTGAEANSAADGDFDIALALLYAYRQWGEFMGIDDACGNPISYKYEAIEFIKALTDTLRYEASGNLLSGDIGLDGYFKSGDSWAELSGWSGDHKLTGFTEPVELPGPEEQFFDYSAPSYFHQFADFLAEEDSAAYAWNIYQFRRAAASTDWLMGHLSAVDPKNIPFAGTVTIPYDTVVSFSNYSSGEDFRLGWRTILSCVWHGDPGYTWDPVAHQVVQGRSNTFERDMGTRFARFLWDTRQEPWGCDCVNSAGPNEHTYWGPSVLGAQYSVTGEDILFNFNLNWVQGAGSPSAVISRNFDLMAEMYRQCEIEYDVDEPGDGYLTSVPFYFNGWFRLLGMLVLSGNYMPPLQVRPTANMKVYCDVDKTCARKNEEITWSVSYRNYGSVDAAQVTIIDTLPSGLSYVSSTSSGHYQESAHTVTWNIGTVPGFRSAKGIAPTCGMVQVTLRVDDDTKRQCRNRVGVSSGNGGRWQANEFPNDVSFTLKRNFVDILDKPLMAEEGIYNLPELYGGRPGVHFSFSMTSDPQSTMNTMRIRMFNDADEAYIGFGNYRFSYFLQDDEMDCMAGEPACTTGWDVMQVITEGVDESHLKIINEKTVPGGTVYGAWNQRIIIQAGNPDDSAYDYAIGTINRHLESYRGMRGRIHRGGIEPLRLVFYVNASSWQPVTWSDDWSWNGDISDDDGGDYFPITPDFTDPAPDNPGIQVDRLNPKYCETSDVTVDNILVEEWDGYVWRRVFGKVPQLTAAVKTVKPQIGNLTQLSINGKHRICYTVPEGGPVTLDLIDIKGRIVTTLVNEHRKAGTYTVPLSNVIGSNMYIVRLKNTDGSLQKKMAFYK